jgi:hypothetical protein
MAAVTTKIGSAFAEKSWTKTSATSPTHELARQYVSAPIAAQTITGTFTAYIRAREPGTTDNVSSQLLVKVVSGDGATVRGTLVPLDSPGALTSEWASSGTAGAGTNRRFPRLALTSTVTSVAAQAGDRIVMEFGGRQGSTTTGRVSGIQLGDAGASDLPADETTVTATLNPWAEFSQTITFPSVTDPGTAPTLAEVATDAEDTSNTVALTASVTIAAGDVIVVKATSPRGDASAYNTPTATGLAFTLRISEYTQTNHNRAAIWTAVAASALGATTITWTWTGLANFHSMVVERWSDAQLDPTPVTVVAFGTGSLPSTTITPEAANSVITMLNTDWVPTNPVGRAWVTTSTTDATVWETFMKFVSLNYWTAYAYMRVGAIGSKTIGMSAPSGQNWTIIGVELLAPSAAPAPHKGQVMISRQAVHRASRW